MGWARFEPYCALRPNRLNFSMVFFEPRISFYKCMLGSLEKNPMKGAPPPSLPKAYISHVDNWLS